MSIRTILSLATDCGLLVENEETARGEATRPAPSLSSVLSAPSVFGRVTLCQVDTSLSGPISWGLPVEKSHMMLHTVDLPLVRGYSFTQMLR